jgi:hypothetical protein
MQSSLKHKDWKQQNSDGSKSLKEEKFNRRQGKRRKSKHTGNMLPG